MAIQPLAAGLRIGEWTVEPALNQLSAPGRSVKVEPKAIEVLLYLAAHPGQVASREELLAELWRGVVVGDDVVTQVVIKLRKALGESYIQTIPKRGYRLVAPVTQPAQRASAARSRRPWRAGAAVALAAIAAIGILAATQRAAPPPPDRMDTSAPSLPTVLVRRFEPVSEDAEAALLARGMTADLLAELSRLSGFSIVDAAVTEPSAAGGYLVSGTVQRSGDRVRINVFLAEARSGKQLWAERFDRDRASFFAIQEEIARSIIQTLPAKVSEEELRRIARPHTRNLEAYALFQQGQAALAVRRREDNEAARALFQKAIAADGGFARAYASLALTYLADYRNQWASDRAAALARGFELAQAARQINPESPEPYFALSWLYTHRGEHAEALAQLEHVKRMAPSYADGYAMEAAVHQNAGRPRDSLRPLRAALRLNPEGTFFYSVLLGRAHFFLGDLQQARINLEHGLARNPEYLEAYVYLAAVYVATGNESEAAWKAEEIRALEPGFSVRRWLETHPLSSTAQRASVERALTGLGL